MQSEVAALSRSVLQLKENESAIVTAVRAGDSLKNELAAHGLTVGAEIRFIKSAPLGDPIQLRVMGGSLCIRKRDAEGIFVSEMGGTEA